MQKTCRDCSLPIEPNQPFRVFRVGGGVQHYRHDSRATCNTLLIYRRLAGDPVASQDTHLDRVSRVIRIARQIHRTLSDYEVEVLAANGQDNLQSIKEHLNKNAKTSRKTLRPVP